jgi:hypothetical protein
MDWIVNLFTNTESVAHIALLYAIVIAIGVYLRQYPTSKAPAFPEWQMGENRR